MSFVMKTTPLRTLTTAFVPCLAILSAYAVEPVVYWDGAEAGHDFSTLTRTVGTTTYTLNLNEQNAVGGNGSYIKIGNENAKKAVTLTADTANAFGTAGAVTIIMKCRNMNVSDNPRRGVIGISNGTLYSDGKDHSNSMKIGFATYYQGYISYLYEGKEYVWIEPTAYFTSAEQVVGMTYSSESGTSVFLNGKMIQQSSTLKQGIFTTPTAVLLGGIDTDDSSVIYAQTGMKIEAVAVYTNCLSATDMKKKAITASAVNEDFGSDKDITVQLDDGAVFFGDTTFTSATNVKFVCNGSITVFPPANNTAALDFSGVTGDAVVQYSGSLPSVVGDVFTATSVPLWVTNSAAWTKTVAISSVTGAKPLNIQNYGNINSTIKLSAISDSYLPNSNIKVGRVVLTDGNSTALALTDGYSNRCATFSELAGSGTIAFIPSGAGANQGLQALSQGLTINTLTNFTGTLALTNMTVTLGTTLRTGRYDDNLTEDTPYKYKLYIDQDANVSVPAGLRLWEPLNGIVFDGPVNFTTDATDYDGLVLFEGVGSSGLTFGEHYKVSINGIDLDRSNYLVRRENGRLVVKKKHLFSIILR